MSYNTTPIIATPTPGDDEPKDPEDLQERHAKQTDRLAKLGLLRTTSFTIPIDQRFKILSAGRPVEAAALSMNTEKAVYAFNVIVAMEWQPSESEQRLLIEAFTRAAAFLYDVTDGCMSFGQIVFGGLELMDCADIQIMASNRFNPRSWVNALMDQTKYMPIRVGRGVWHKNQRRSIPWVEPEGYRTLIHEWAHYALALRDEYLETKQVLLSSSTASADSAATRTLYTLIVPGLSLATESIMGSLEGTSELVPLSGGNSAERKNRVWNKIKEHYHEVNPDSVPNSGPYSLPPRLANVPVFFVSDRYAHTGNGTARALTVSTKSYGLARRKSGLMLTVPSYIVDEHCWIYVVKPDLDNPSQVIAQGTFDARSTLDNFQLLNAEPGNGVVLIGEHQDGNPIVLQGQIVATVDDEPSGEARAIVEWAEPSTTPQPFPIVDVVAEACHAEQATANVRVHIKGDEAPDWVGLFPLGQPQDQPALTQPDAASGAWSRAGDPPSSLDGHVLMCWKHGARLICTYSQGGGPATHVASQGSPITAGSSEGNVMIFFKDNDASQRYGNVRLVTTLIHGHPIAPPQHTEPRSYLFSVTCNEPLPVNLTPTLIMSFDSAAIHDDGNLQIYRLAQDDTWQPMPTYIPRGASFAAMPMDRTTAANLVARGNGPRVEHYRLFWTPRDPGL